MALNAVDLEREIFNELNKHFDSIFQQEAKFSPSLKQSMQKMMKLIAKSAAPIILHITTKGTITGNTGDGGAPPHQHPGGTLKIT